MTKFLSSTEYLYPPHGGGEHALRNLLIQLEQNGHKTTALHTGKPDPSIQDRVVNTPNIPGGWTRNFLQSTIWYKKLSEQIDKKQPDYVITQLGLAPVTQKICQKKDVPCIILLIDYSHICIERLSNGQNLQHSCLKNSRPKFKWQYPFYHILQNRFEHAIKEAEHTFSNSHYMKTKTKAVTGIETDVLYPPVDYTQTDSETNRAEYITIINPSKHKGGETFAQIAEKMPEEKFFALGQASPKTQSKLENLSNVKTTDHVQDISKVYSNTKLLLVPSQWPEPFGMVAAEAMHNNIPVLVSQKGGLPETTQFQELQLQNYRTPEAWKKRINSRTWNKKHKYREHSEKFSAENTAERFLNKIGETN